MFYSETELNKLRAENEILHELNDYLKTLNGDK